MKIEFTEQELTFLCREFGLSGEQVGELTEDELLEISDRCFDIELEGELGSGRKMPDRCGVAAKIVTKVNEFIG